MSSITKKLEKLNHQIHFDISLVPLGIREVFIKRSECAKRIIKNKMNPITREAHFELLENYNELIKKYFAI